MQKVGSILGRFDKNLGPVIKVRDRWPQVAGELLSQHCRPVRIKQATLELLCDSPAYVQQVDLFASELLPRVNKACGLKLKRIEARFGYLSEPVKVYRPQQRQARSVELDPDDAARVRSPELRAILEDMLEQRKA